MGENQSDHIEILIAEYVRLQNLHQQTVESVSSIATQRRVVVEQLVLLMNGSKSAAGRRLGISPPMVSRILSRDPERRKVHNERDRNTNTTT